MPSQSKTTSLLFRRGSVLLMVIVLLLLLSILGTAYLSTSRTDRITSAQNTLSVQNDALTDGIAKTVGGILVNDLYDDFGNLRGAISTTSMRAPPWSSGIAYSVGNIVIDPSSQTYYLCISAPPIGTPVSNGTYWMVPASMQSGYRRYYRGVYAAANTYNLGDIVSDGQTPPSFYVCQQYAVNTPPPLPPTYTQSIDWLQTTHLGIDSYQSEPWLAQRIPSIPNPAAAAAAGNQPYWQNVSQSAQNFLVTAGSPPVLAPVSLLARGDMSLAKPPMSFESPDGAVLPTVAAPPPYQILYPGFGLLNGIATPILSPAVIPATPPPLAAANTMIAADADGDGIADSLLFRIPGVNLDGLTWYAAVRIVDGNSAINANTAWSRDQDYDFADGPIPNYGFYQSNIGLAELLNAGDQQLVAGTPNIAKAFNAYRLNNLTAYPITSNVPSDETLVTPPTSGYPPPLPGYPTSPQRGDFAFISQGDALYHQFIGRLDNPGINFDTNTNTYKRYQALSFSDTAALAYHFCLTNPNSGGSLLESLLPASLANNANLQSTPFVNLNTALGYPAQNIFDWWNKDFYYDITPAGNTMSLRPLLLTRNPVSNYIDPVYDPISLGEPLSGQMLPYGEGTTGHYKGMWNAAATYAINDIVSYLGFTFLSPQGGNMNNIPATISNGGVITVNPAGNPVWQLQPWNYHPTKANVNTATFAELFRAFWCVMAGNPGDQTPFGAATQPDPYQDSGTPINPQHQFRSPVRDPNYTPGYTPSLMTPSDVMLLRAAIASVNTMGLRDQSQNVISRTVWLHASTTNPSNAAVVRDVEARVYSAAPQPFITEVYANNYNGTHDPNDTKSLGNPAGYVAVELYNPYTTAISMNNWQLAYIPRPAAGTYPNLKMTALLTLGATAVVPARGYLLLENCVYNATATTMPSTQPATYRPQSSGIVGDSVTNVWVGGADVYVPLETVTASPGAELVLLRPRMANGTLTKSTDPMNAYDETTNLADLVPVDSYDFTGFPVSPPALVTSQYTFWSYLRGKGTTAPNQLFKATYPGRYSTTAGLTPRQGPDNATNATNALESAIISSMVNFPIGWVPSYGAATQPSYPNAFPPIQIYNTGPFGGNPEHVPNAVITPGGATPAPLAFPFGTFARNGDMLDIPYIGAYRIRVVSTGGGPLSTPIDPFTGAPNTPDTFLELNSLPMDSSFADDTDTTDDGAENVGRFCPTTRPASTYADYYGWTRTLFNYLTVQSGNTDSTPNFDAGMNDVTTPAAPFVTKYPPGAAVTPTPPTPVYNKDGIATDQISQDNVGVDGLINVNTASWKVLSTLPMVTYAETGETTANHPNATAANENLAKAIVVWRDGDTIGHVPHGPFMSIFDLMQVFDQVTPTNLITTLPNNFYNAYGWMALANQGTAPVLTGTAPYPPYSGNGILIPPDPAFPKITTAPPASIVYPPQVEDFQGDFAVLNRVSNLITTRSDTFTVYIVVEGWQNACLPGQAPYNPATVPPMPVPQLKALRRIAFIADRSTINADFKSRFLKTIYFPND